MKAIISVYLSFTHNSTDHKNKDWYRTILFIQHSASQTLDPKVCGQGVYSQGN